MGHRWCSSPSPRAWAGRSSDGFGGVCSTGTGLCPAQCLCPSRVSNVPKLPWVLEEVCPCQHSVSQQCRQGAPTPCHEAAPSLTKGDFRKLPTRSQPVLYQLHWKPGWGLEQERHPSGIFHWTTCSAEVPDQVKFLTTKRLLTLERLMCKRDPSLSQRSLC